MQVRIRREINRWVITTHFDGGITTTFVDYNQRLLFKCLHCDEIHELNASMVSDGEELDLEDDMKLIRDVGQDAIPVQIE